MVIGFTGGCGITVGRDVATTGTPAGTLECSLWRNTGGAFDGCWRVVVGWNVLICSSGGLGLPPGSALFGGNKEFFIGLSDTDTEGRKEIGRGVEGAEGWKGLKGLLKFGIILVGLAGVLTRKMLGCRPCVVAWSL